FTGDAGAATSAELNNPIAVALDSSLNLYIADSANNRIRKVALTKISTFAGGKSGAGYSGDGGQATGAQLNGPYGVWVDANGNVDIADLTNQVIRQVNSSGVISTIAGNNTGGYSGDGAPAISAQLGNPFAVVTDTSGNLYITDSFTNRVRIVTPDGNINTLIGTGWNVFGCPNGPTVNITIQKPLGMATDSAGNLYFADSDNNCVRMVTPNGNIRTVAGTGATGLPGDGGPAINARLYRPSAVAVDAWGDIFIADTFNSRIRMVTPDGNINTIAGGTGVGYTGDGFIATNARLNFPSGVAVDNNGLVYIADSNNNVIRLLTPQAPAVSTGGVIGAADFGAFSSVAPGSWIEIYGANLAIGQRPWNPGDFSGPSAPTSLAGTSVTIGGQPAYVEYVSGNHVNVQVPSNVGTGQQPLVVKTAYGSSGSYSVNVNALQPGLWAPAGFKIGGLQFAGATFSDGTTFVLPTGAIPGLPSRPAKAGDIIVLYGIGFGPVNPGTPAGQIAPASTSLPGSVQFSFGQAAATYKYAGLAPGAVGLYQFNVVVPSVPAGNTALTFTLGGAAGTQTLYVPVQ
ncbi:MAG TPA: IPT/TIG domain-containing protein, partial [Candidatus Sulfopaludibacter sp.]|nr:IPT/TIG domain-containing protein [Candidatus Sulfopaludibacter sp.]